jgi:hypothetical protein
VATPIIKLLRLMDGDAPAMGKIYPHMIAIQKSMETSSVLWKEKALAIHASRQVYLLSPMHLAGYALDPEFIDHEMTGEVQEALITITERLLLCEEMRKLVRAGEQAAARALTDESECVMEAVGAAMMELASYQGKEGVLGRPFVKNHAKIMPPSKWWATYGKGLPNLSAVACSVLAQAVAASICERNWSIYGRIKADNRSALKHATADRLVYCHEALHMREKMKNASYKEPVVEWADSDSDSDASDEEDYAQ